MAKQADKAQLLSSLGILPEEFSDALAAIRSSRGLVRPHAKALLHASRQRVLDVAHGQGCKCA